MFLLFLSASFVAAQNNSKSIQKCWNLPAIVVADAGLVADTTQGYFVDDRARLVAVELGTGAINWTAEFGGQPNSQIALSADGVMVASRSAASGSADRPVTLRKFNRSTGLVSWQVTLAAADRHYIEQTDEGILTIAESGEIRMLRASDGTPIWTVSTAPLLTPPRTEGGRLLIASRPKTIREFSVSDGGRKWEAEIKYIPYLLGIGNGNGSVYSDEKGTIYAIDQKGDVRWNFRAGGKVVYITAIGENLLIGSSDNFVYFMSAEYGNLLWKRRLPGRVASGGLISEKRAAFTVVGDDVAFILDLEKGRLIDKLQLESEDAFLLTPIRANGIYLLAATAKGLSAFSETCGNEKSGTRAPLS